MGKGWTWIQNDNYEIELVQLDIEDAFHEINKLHKQNKLDNSIRGNFLKEFVECTRECISELEEKLESLKEWVNALLRLHGKKD